MSRKKIFSYDIYFGTLGKSLYESNLVKFNYLKTVISEIHCFHIIIIKYE